MERHTIDLDLIIDFMNEVGSTIIDIWYMFSFSIGGHTYSGFLVLIAVLVFFFLLENVWGDNDEDD